ncbi:M56 family metallopeptidase [Aggregatilinea lenta]|uniref:M56 family metallopeptidase n=1 Tax=Aggregatilinea lenta TaxID=913108 RepID=UPI000E5BF25E|nr:M56 family metallopeptidase [Aggregatilinea lenta]
MVDVLLEQGVEVIIRSSLLVVVAFVATFALHRASASVRYWVWVLTFGGLLALPVMIAAGPLLTIITSSHDVISAPTVTPVEMNGVQFSAFDAPAAMPDLSPETNGISAPATQNPVVQPTPAVRTRDATSVPEARRETASSRLDLDSLAALIWIVGAAAILGYGAVQWSKLARAIRVASNECDAWKPLFTEVVRMLRLRRPVRLIFADAITAPMAWGTLRPAVLLPLDAKSWDADRQRIVLTHELIHIKRFDTLINALALLICALYWFNPLAWLALHRLTSECEQSCDDLVLSGGTRGSDYAAHLVAVAYTALYQRRLLPGVTPLSQNTHAIQA